MMASIRQHPQLPSDSWYLVAAATLAVLNRPDEIAAVYLHALEHGGGASSSKPAKEEQLRISRRTREALIKASAVGGIPKVFTRRPRTRAARAMAL